MSSHHIALLKDGVEKWNEWRAANPGSIAQLGGVSLSHMNLCGGDFRNANLSGANLTKCQLGGADFTDANLEKSVLYQVEAKEKVVFVNVRADGLNLNGALLEEADFTDAILTHSTMVGLIAERVVFDNANLTNADMTSLKAQVASFVSARLIRAKLANCRIESGTFDDAGLLIAEMQGSILNNCKFKRANLRGANLNSATLREADFTGADFHEAELRGCDCFGTVLINTSGLGELAQPGHPTAKMIDVVNSEHTIFARGFDGFTSWPRLRAFGNLPLFGVSYAGIASIAVWTTTVHMANQWITAFQSKKILGHEWLQEIPAISISWQTALTLIGLVTLAVASTVYKLKCPPEIQEYTETGWATAHGKPRLNYRAIGTRHRIFRAATAVMYAFAALILLPLFVWRIFCAIVYAFTG